MNSIFESVSNFFSNVELNLMIAGGLMILTGLLIIYIVAVVWFSLKRRSELSKVKLPEIDGVGKGSLTEPEFESVMPLDVELITNEDELVPESKGEEKDIFTAALIMESRSYIPDKDIHMPNISKQINETSEKRELGV